MRVGCALCRGGGGEAGILCTLLWKWMRARECVLCIALHFFGAEYAGRCCILVSAVTRAEERLVSWRGTLKERK